MRKTERHNKKRNRFSIFFPILTIIGIGILFTFSSFYEKSWSYNWSGISEEVRNSVKVAEYDGISNGGVGISNRKPKQYDRRHWIMQNATESELLKLTDYPNGTIKTIAYEGLIRKSDFNNKTGLVLKSIKDTEYPIEYQMGCVGAQMYISEYLIDFVLNINNESPLLPDGLKNRYGFSENDIEKIMTEYQTQPSLWK
jgi:hypothetical protein